MDPTVFMQVNDQCAAVLEVGIIEKKSLFKHCNFEPFFVVVVDFKKALELLHVIKYANAIPIRV